MALKRRPLRKMRPSKTVVCATSPHVVEQKYIFSGQLAWANEMRTVTGNLPWVLAKGNRARER